MTRNPSNHKWWTLFAMCFALFMIMLDNTVVNVALPSIQRSLRTTPENLQWTIDAYVLSFAVLILLGGKLGDRFGRKRMFVLGLGIFTLASALCALAESDVQLIAFRMLQGVGAALLNPLSLSILVAAFPRKQLPTAIGIWAGISGLGLAIGPLVGGFLVEHVSWSAVFWINVPVGVVASAVCLWAVAESRDETARRLDLVGTGLVTVAMFGLVWGLIKATSHGWVSVYTLGFLGGALALFAVFVAWERRQDDPMIPLAFFRSRAFTVSTVVVTLVTLGFFGVIFSITLYFQNVKGWSPLEAGLRSLPMSGMVMILGPFAGKLNAKLGPRVQMSGGMLLAACGLFGLSRIGVHSSYMDIWPYYVLTGGGVAFTMPAVSATAMGAVEQTKAGVASGVVNASRQVGGALGIAVLGSLGAALARQEWKHELAALPPAVQERAGHLTSAVLGGQGRVVGAAAGPQAQEAAFNAFVHGVKGAMLVAAALALASSLTAFVGLRGVRVRRPAPEAVAVEA